MDKGTFLGYIDEGWELGRHGWWLENVIGVQKYVIRKDGD
jgi:hypothetical protein